MLNFKFLTHQENSRCVMLVTINVAVSFIQDPSLAMKVPFYDDVMTPVLPVDTVKILSKARDMFL